MDHFSTGIIRRITFFVNRATSSNHERGSDTEGKFQVPGSSSHRVIRKSIDTGNNGAAASNFDTQKATAAAAKITADSLINLSSENASSSSVRKNPVQNLIIASHVTEVVPVKTVVEGIKTADLLLKGIKTVHGVMILLDTQGGGVVSLGSPDGIVLGIKAAKVFMKGFKMSKKALGSGSKQTGPKTWMQKVFKDVSSGFKASSGAMNVVRSSRAIMSEVTSGKMALCNWNLVVKGYEASKGVLNAVEALTSLKVGFVAAFGKGFLGLKGAIGGFGVMIKAFVVSKELYVFLIKGIGLSHGAREVFKIISEKRKSSRVETFCNISNARFHIKTTFISGRLRQRFNKRIYIKKRSFERRKMFRQTFLGDFEELATILSVQGMVSM